MASRYLHEAGFHVWESPLRQRALLMLLSLYVRPVSPHAHESPEWAAALEMSCADAVSMLAEEGYLRGHRAAWAWALRFLPARVHDTYVLTSRGRKAVRVFQRQLEDQRQDAERAMDRCFARGDVQAAARVLAEYNALQVFPRPLWNGAEGPSPADLRAARIVLKSQPQVFSQVDLDEHETRAIRYQAAEVALAHEIFFNRLVPLKRELHPQGNAWLVSALYAYGRRQASATGELHTNDWTPPDDSADMGVAPVGELPRVRVPVRIKITLPYVILALAFALVGAYLVSRVVFESLEDRFTNQLIEMGKLSADRMVLEESQRLKTLRLIANTEGVAAAVSARHAERLRLLVLPLAVNAQEEAVEILDSQGRSILSLRHQPGDPIEQYQSTRDDTGFGQWPFVQHVLQGRVDAGRDKYAGLVNTTWGAFFYVAGPLLDDSGSLIGVVLVGKSLESLVSQFRQDTLAQTTIYDLNGNQLASTFLPVESETHRLAPDQVTPALDQQTSRSLIRPLSVASVRYSEIIGPWEVRGGADLGLIGAAIPQRFLIRTTQSTRVQIVVFVVLGVLAAVLVGVYIARRITRPLLRVVRASAKVAQGDLDVKVNPEGNDEVAVLAHSFNRMLAGLRDATERRLREIELLQALEREKDLRELKSRFVSMVSHEFRTPLATILSSAEYVQTYGHLTTPEKQQKHFTRIQTAVGNMNRLLEEVLLIGRQESDRLEFNPVLLDLERFCREIADEMQANAGPRHQLIFSSWLRTRQVMIDENLLRLALTNLLSNAIKYSPQGGPVRFSLFNEDVYFVCQIQDQGIGIPAADQKRLFESFHRAKNVGTISGTGLGLYVTRMAVELHDGTIRVESEEGVGTLFTISIPVVRSGEAAQ